MIKNNMSTITTEFLKKHPLLILYTQMGLININALARYIKENSMEMDLSSSAAISMDIRRYLSKMPKQKKPHFTLEPLHIVTRTHIQEFVFNNNMQNRKICLALFDRIAKLNQFSCIVEGEKEIVFITNSFTPLGKDEKKNISFHTEGLGFISIDFPMKMREVIGIYNYITSALMLANISIHAFHTIGGEILILVKNDDLLKTQEALSSILQS